MKRFSGDKHGHAVAPELDCLQRKLCSSDKILSAHHNGQHDIDIFPVYSIISGPMKMIYLQSKWNAVDYQEIWKFFEVDKKLN